VNHPHGSAHDQRPLLLEIKGLSKSFGGAQALDRVNFTVGYGEIHGLLGHNGSGKSTLIKVLSGFHRPDPGSLIRLRGEPVTLPMPARAMRTLGISFVHQHLGLIPSLTVLENFMLGDLGTASNWAIRWGAQTDETRALFKRYGLDLDPADLVADISPVGRALLAIVRAFNDLRQNNGGLLILDEPTPFLPRRDVQRLFVLIRQVVAQGASVIFVSHDIDEVQEITDRATVLRDGKVAGAFLTKETGKEQIVEMIVGRRITRGHSTTTQSAGPPTGWIRRLSGDVVNDVTIDLRQGEILGLTGLIGSGYDEIPSLLYGARQARCGQMQFQGKSIALPTLTPRQAIAQQCVLIPADRQNNAVFGTLSLTENLGMPLYDTVVRPWFMTERMLKKHVQGLLERFDIRPRNPERVMNDFSGGNQQKAVMAKWLQLQPKLILLDEPTQGVDVGAREQLFEHLRQAARQGATIILASSDFEQLESLCDRILVFNKGKIDAELIGDQINKNQIAESCFGADIHT